MIGVSLDATGTTTYEYDAAGRFSGIVYPHGGSVRYVRDALGRTVQQSVRATSSASPLVTLYAYDAVGNLSEVTDPQGGKTTFVYDAENRLTSRTLPNNVVTTYAYDARDRPLSVVHRNAANLVLASRTYVRAPGGEPTRITKEDGSYVEVGYDTALRITSERYYTSAGDLDDELRYTYDADGNRLTKSVNGVASTYAYASGARLTGITTAGVTEGRTTDNGGRETALALMSHQLALTYDSDDHVTRVVDGANSTDFAFDAAGRRVRVTSAGGTKRFLTAPNAGDGYESPQAITDASGALIASYVFAGETPIAKNTSAGTQYYLTDALGSVIATSGETGTLVSTLDYDAFGNERTSGALAGDTHGDFRLHGMWKDPSGLYYVRARVYDAETGRFTSRDPALGEAQAPEAYSPYAMAEGNTWTKKDPTGLFSTAPEASAALGSNLALATVAVATTNIMTRGTRRAGEIFSVTFQAQGDVFRGPLKKRIRSVSIRQASPVAVSQGLEALEQVRAQLSGRIADAFDSAEAFEDAARWLRGLPPFGAGPPGHNEFGKARGGFLRVDIAIYSGVKFTH